MRGAHTKAASWETKLTTALHKIGNKQKRKVDCIVLDAMFVVLKLQTGSAFDVAPVRNPSTTNSMFLFIAHPECSGQLFGVCAVYKWSILLQISSGINRDPSRGRYKVHQFYKNK